MKLSFGYVLPDPASYRDWADFEGDLACVRKAGFAAVELQIADPAKCDEQRLRAALDAAGLPLRAVQSGGTYASRGNCLCTADRAVRERTIALLKSFVDFATRWEAPIVFGSLQGRLCDEPDEAAGRRRIEQAVARVCRYATRRGAVLALEPVNHLEVGWHHSIAEVEPWVRALDLPSARLMIDTFHMNIEERDMLAPLAGIRDILAHVHLSETNRDVLGTGRWPLAEFLAELARIGYAGVVSVGVYNTCLSRRECIRRCGQRLREVWR